MAEKPGLSLICQPQAFFHELVTSALGNQKISAQPEVEFYLVNLLNHFINTENLYMRDKEGNYREEPLVFLLKEAIEEKENQAQQLLFRHIGDVSLYFAGFFQESLSRKRVEVDYYIDMGGRAYQHAAERTEKKNLQNIFEELALKFSNFVKVFEEVSEKTQIPNESEIIRLYGKWTETRNDRAEKVLRNAGIVPDPRLVSRSPVVSSTPSTKNKSRSGKKSSKKGKWH